MTIYPNEKRSRMARHEFYHYVSLDVDTTVDVV